MINIHIYIKSETWYLVIYNAGQDMIFILQKFIESWKVVSQTVGLKLGLYSEKGSHFRGQHKFLHCGLKIEKANVFYGVTFIIGLNWFCSLQGFNTSGFQSQTIKDCFDQFRTQFFAVAFLNETDLFGSGRQMCLELWSDSVLCVCGGAFWLSLCLFFFVPLWPFSLIR